MTELVVTPGMEPYIALRVYVEPPRDETMDAETREAIDRTP